MPSSKRHFSSPHQLAKIAALSRVARPTYDGAEATAAARRAFLDHFFNDTDPDLPLARRMQIAEANKRLHMVKAAQARWARYRALRKRWDGPAQYDDSKDTTAEAP